MKYTINADGEIQTLGELYHSALYHHGIKGQKWGVRRFQNKNGSLTPEGKERYNKSSQTRKYSPEEEAFLSGKKSFDESVKAIAGKDGVGATMMTEVSYHHIRNGIHKAVESGDTNNLQRQYDNNDLEACIDVRSKDGIDLGYTKAFDVDSPRWDKPISDSDLEGASVKVSAMMEVKRGVFAVIDDANVAWDTSDRDKTQRAIVDAKIIGNSSEYKSVSGKLLIEGSINDIIRNGYLPHSNVAFITSTESKSEPLMDMRDPRWEKVNGEWKLVYPK